MSEAPRSSSGPAAAPPSREGGRGRQCGALDLCRWRELKPKLASQLDVLKPFDPWSGPLCTCPPKLALDVYSGCGYECVYCYVSAYNARCWGSDRVRPKRDVVRRLERDLGRLHWRLELAGLGGLPVALSNSSDPYPAAAQADEAALLLTRRALEVLVAAGHPLLVTTKSPLVMRDLDLLAQVPSVLAMTVTVLDATTARRLEPLASDPRERLAALGEAARLGLSVACRVDPLIPGVNDEPEDLAPLLDDLAAAGVKRVICSTYKHRPDAFRRLAEVFPNQTRRIAELLDRTRRVSGYYYLQAEFRREMLERVQALAHKRGLTISVCREKIAGVSDGICDARDLEDALRPEGDI